MAAGAAKVNSCHAPTGIERKGKNVQNHYCNTSMLLVDFVVVIVPVGVVFSSDPVLNQEWTASLAVLKASRLSKPSNATLPASCSIS